MLIFDLDGTILDSNRIWQEVDKTFLSRRNLPYTQEYYQGVAHSILSDCAVFTKNFFQLEESCDDIIHEWLELAQDAYHSVPLKPYVREYLDICQYEEKEMALFTNCVPEHCKAALKHHGLEHYFGYNVVFAQELGVNKNSPECFRKAADALYIRPRQCVLFDDSLAACKAAKAAGMTVVGIRDDAFPNEQTDMREVCDHYINGFGDLLRVLGKL